MIVTNHESGTNVEEIADDIYRINTPMTLPNGGGFSFNQYLILDKAPLLFHTGLRAVCPGAQSRGEPVADRKGCATSASPM